MKRTWIVAAALLALFSGFNLVRSWRTPRVAPVQEIALGTPTAPRDLPKVVSDVAKPAAFEEVDRIDELFLLGPGKLPIVETVSYTSRVPWLKERPAWIADYAAHYETSRHFIARSLNKKLDYFTQKVHPGDRFNVFKEGKNVQFQLLVDLADCRMWFYYVDGAEKVLLKTYSVSVGKAQQPGTYKLGEKVAIYKPGVMGYFQDEKVEMCKVFGTRWIPFEGSHGLGLKGLAWEEGEDTSLLGKANTDGCIAMAKDDLEELFAIVITKPTTIDIK